MSEEKKVIKLKEEELEKVASGFTAEAETHSFNCGDTFKLNDYVHDIYFFRTKWKSI